MEISEESHIHLHPITSHSYFSMGDTEKKLGGETPTNNNVLNLGVTVFAA